jgi:hypothetical protein
MTTTQPSMPQREPRHLALPIVFTVLLLFVVAGLIVIASDWQHTTTTGATIEGSGVAATETRDVAPFTSVDLAGSNNVTIQVGAEQAVRVHADDNLVRRVTTTVRDGELVIDNRGSFRTQVLMTVEVSVPRLDGLTVSGSGNVSVQGVRADAFGVRLPGSGNIVVTGTADRLTATLDGSGQLQLTNLVATDATAVVSGSGVIRLTATGSLSASISGSGTIQYGGSPEDVTQSVTGSGAIIAL